MPCSIEVAKSASANKISNTSVQINFLPYQFSLAGKIFSLPDLSKSGKEKGWVGNPDPNTDMSTTYLGFPLRAAWWSALNPLLLVTQMSALWSRRSERMSSLFLLMASCRGVSPSESCEDETRWKQKLKFNVSCNLICYKSNLYNAKKLISNVLTWI